MSNSIRARINRDLHEPNIINQLNFLRNNQKEGEPFLVKIGCLINTYQSSDFDFIRAAGYVVTLNEEDSSWHIELPQS